MKLFKMFSMLVVLSGVAVTSAHAAVDSAEAIAGRQCELSAARLKQKQKVKEAEMKPIQEEAPKQATPVSGAVQAT